MADGRALTLRFTSDVEGAKASLASLATSVVGTMNSIGSVLMSTTAGARAQEAAVSQLGRAWTTLAEAGRINWATAIPSVAGLTAAIVGYEALSHAVSAAREQLSEMAEVGRDAEKAGVGAEFFQSFVRASRDARSSEKDFEEILTNISRTARDRFDESKDAVNDFIEKVKEFALLNPRFEQGDLKGLNQFYDAGNTEQRARAILQILKDIQENAGTLAAIDFAKIAGGDKLAEGLRSGKIELQKIIDLVDSRANLAATGYIFSDADAARAKELEERLTRAWQIVDDELKPSWERLASILMDVKSTWTDIVEVVGKVLHVVNQMNDAITAATAGAANMASILGGLIPGLNVISGAGIGRRLGEMLTAPTTEQKARGIGITFGDEGEYPQVPLSTFGGRVPDRRPLNVPTTKEKAGSDTDEGKDAVERFVDNLEKSVAALQAEKNAQGLSNTEKQVAINLAKAAAAAKADDAEFTDEEKRKIESLTRAQVALKESIEKSTKAQRDQAEAVRYFGDEAANALSDMILEGKSASEVFSSLSKTILRSLISASITGSGSLAGILGMSGTTGTGNVGGLAGLLVSAFRSGGTGNTVGSLSAAETAQLSQGLSFQFHTGGIAGYGGISRVVDPSIFAFARRYHSGGIVGLDYDEIPAILQKGERVIPNGGSAGGDVIINAYHEAGTTSQVTGTRTGADGTRHVDLLVKQIESALASRAASGQSSLARAMAGSYGLTRQGIR